LYGGGCIVWGMGGEGWDTMRRMEYFKAVSALWVGEICSNYILADVGL